MVQLLTATIHTNEQTKELGDMATSLVASGPPSELEMESRLEHHGAGRTVIRPAALEDLGKAHGLHRALRRRILWLWANG